MSNRLISSASYADSKPHYHILDGLRGAAALMVVWYHVFEGFAFAEGTNGVEGGGLIDVFNHGYLAVDFFFMLSGFVISYAYDDRWNKMPIGASASDDCDGCHHRYGDLPFGWMHEVGWFGDPDVGCSVGFLPYLLLHPCLAGCDARGAW